MQLAQKIGMGFILIGMATAVLLPGRQTVPVIGAFTDFFRGSLATAMGTGKTV